MKIVSSYKVKLQAQQYFLQITAELYRAAVAFLIESINKSWDSICPIYKDNPKKGKTYTEHLIHKTQKNPSPVYNFDAKFPKFPGYLRRAAINQALGAVSSYRSAMKNWIDGGKTTCEPTLTFDRDVMPAFFRDGMSRVDDMLAGKTDIVDLRLYNGSDWVWVAILCRHQDVKYLTKHWFDVKASAPVLEIRHVNAHSSTDWRKPGSNRRHKRCKKHAGNIFYLRFAYEEKRDLSLRDTSLKDRTVLAVDLGINTCATCSVMTSDGTVTARKFIDFPVEKDHLNHLVNKVKRAQREHGRTGGTREWAKATRCNEDLSRKIAAAIVDFAVLYAVDVIVFEHLDTKGKKHGKNKQKLHLWRKNTIQRIVEQKAHRNLIRISRVCAWGTSKLAFDGSGEVERCISNDGQKKNYSLCVFKSGKQYNCDLNASYNIGARYFLRAWSNEVADLVGKLPSASKRTWADLWRLFHSKEVQAA